MRQPNFQIIETNGIRLRAAVGGSGPLVVLVHGFPESWYSYRYQLEALQAAGFSFAAIDVRGYGGSDKPEAIEAYSLSSLAADVAGVIAALGGGPAILIGHDWGAPIVWTTALLHRAQVRAVVGMSVPYLGQPPRPLVEIYRALYRDRFFYQLYFQTPGVAEAELEADIPLSLRKTYYSASGDIEPHMQGLVGHKAADAKFLDGLPDPDPLPAWLSAEDLAYYAEQFRAGGFRGPLNRYRNSERDWSELAHLADEKITQPALFIAGERDPVLRFIPGRNLADGMDKFYTDLRGKLLIPKVGHWVQQEAPAAVNAALIDFLHNL
jgi:pimeloyl-ACP methyl ester carboxylesterase